MMKQRMSLSPLSAAIAVATLTGIAGAAGVASPPAARPVAVQAFQQAHPGANFYRTKGHITSVYGEAFSHGTSAVASAEQFLDQHAGIFNISVGDLVPGSLAGDGAHISELMPDLQTGAMRFTLVSYLQSRDGIQVFRGDLRLLMRNEAGSPLVLARSALRDLGDFHPDQAVAQSPNLSAAYAEAQLRFPGVDSCSNPQVVIWAGYDEEYAAPRLAISFFATSGNATTVGYQKWLVVADAATGRTLWTENQIHNVDVTGNVSGMATPGKKADTCETEIVTPLKYARVAIGATVAYADGNGNFTIPNAGASQVTVDSGIRGRWFRVYNGGAEPEAMSLNVTPPGPANFMHNAANTNATFRSGVNAYVNANIVRDFTLFYSPTYPSIGSQTEFRENINVSGTCNAFYDGSSINFYPAGGGCPSTAYGDVVWHEYGHHLVAMAGSGQGMYGEGTGDCMGVLISDDPILGYGFQGNCNAGIRNANNNIQYPQTGQEVHAAGELISGCLWSTRNALVATNPSTYRDILSNIAVNAIRLHTGTEITPQITIDYLTLDDNNGNINDGTPHYSEINTGFTAHNMAAPPLNLIAFNYPSGRPSLLSPAGGQAFTVQVVGVAGSPQPNTGLLFVDDDNNGTYTQYTMNQISTNLYSAVFPAIPCGNTVRYYVSARTTTNATVTDPQNAPTSYYTAISGNALNNVFTDNFQTNLGWTVTNSAGLTTGAWERAVPNPANNNGAAPTTDADGSGQCYVTDNRNTAGNVGAYDVDGGTTTLTSPAINASGGAAFVSYSRWFSNNQGSGADDDQFTVQISGNNGTTWQNLEVVGPNGGAQQHGGWYAKTFPIPGALATTQFKIRFTCGETGPAGSIVEGGVDAVRVQLVACSCPGDYNGDGFVNGSDFDEFVTDFESGDMQADFDNDGFLTGADFDGFVAAFEAGCG